MSQTLALYSYEEILNLKSNAVIPVGFDQEQFNLDFHERIELAKKYRRRSSHHFNSRPKVYRPKPKVSTDENGWSTVVLEADDQAIEDNEEEAAEEVFQESSKTKKAKGTVIKARPNNKNLGSSKAADAKDIQEVNKKSFNAFAALISDEDE
ncbi:hypothetical protein QEN19_001436 [Hanseniaspora menglaensis]